MCASIADASLAIGAGAARSQALAPNTSRTETMEAARRMTDAYTQRPDRVLDTARVKWPDPGEVLN